MLSPAITNQTPEGSGGDITHLALMSLKKMNKQGNIIIKCGAIASRNELTRNCSSWVVVPLLYHCAL
jgi:hypothetical protein